MTDSLYELPTITVRGTPEQLGVGQGEARRAQIQEFVATRIAAFREYSSERGFDISVDRFLARGAECLEIAAAWDPEGMAEHRGIARGAGVPDHELYAITNMTDVRDTLILGPTPDDEGCTSFLLPGRLSADGELTTGQTWDLNPQDLDHVVAVHRFPEAGPETWSVTCVGCLTLVGMNEHGLSVGTTNIKVRGSRPGVGYLSLLHRLIRCTSPAEAAQLIETAPRSGAHTYWVADAVAGFEYEVSHERALRRELKEPLVRTNHCLLEPHVSAQGEPTGSSSASRIDRMAEILAPGGHDVSSLKTAFADRSDGVDSISRFPEDDQGTATNSCVICVPARREIWACRGPSQRGRWIQLEFG